MRIEELILEGFKSYPVRTQITGWDASFNAITGLNGSGKSNILDAICFVLGLTNMTQMRAQNQQDLIYKRGQAGITKASVTIVFDNSDPESSPAGLQDLPQITVTRQIALPNISKYLLNGHKSQQQTVQSLFQSVQLNINNPNFLIMQGRITKVLNMKPQEILGMVEEAAGTRMFEERKDKAKKTMGKKEKRVEEITSLLQEEITPKLDALRNEKRSFLQWQKACSELERIARKLRAWEWNNHSENIRKKDEDVKANAREVKETKNSQKQLLKEAQEAEKDAEEVKKRREKEARKGGKFQKLEAEVKDLEKVVVKVKTQAEIKATTIGEEEKKVQNLENEHKGLEKSLADKQRQVDELTANFTKVKEEQTAAQLTLTNSEELLQTLLTGLAGSSNNTGGGYMGQLADARARFTHAQTEENQARQKLEMSRKELKNLEARWKEVEKEAGQGAKRLQAQKAEIDGLKKRLAATGWTKEKEAEKEAEMKEARAEVGELMEERDSVRQRLGQLDFTYDDPVPNFNRSKVKGLVASLISLKPEDYNKSTALEITAGGKLYHLIVEDSVAGGQLIKNGGLKKRVTLIPLNQIRAFRMAAQKVQTAKRIAPGKVNLALSLIGHPQEVSEAMAFVFGDTLVCNDAATAKAVTFNPEIRARSVTLDGDVYDPSGTLSGGAPPTSNGILVKAQQLQDVNRRLNEANATLRDLIQAEQRDNGKREQWKTLVREVELKEHEVQLLEEQLGGSNATRIGAQVEELKKTIQDLEAEVQRAKDKQKAANDDAKKLEKDMAEFKNNKEGKTEELKASILSQKASLQKRNLAVKLQQKDMQTAALEREGIEKDIELAVGNVNDTQAAIAKLRKELKKLEDQVKEGEARLAGKKAELAEEQATLSRFDEELKDLEQVIADKKQAESALGLQLKTLEHDAQNLEKEKTALMNSVANLEKQYEWIAEENHLFGQTGTQYDFTGIDVKALRTRADDLEQSNRGMKKKVNPKVMAMIEGVEKREAQLKKMLDTVLKDKVKIEQTIEELDRYKRDALTKTWEKVNVDFGEIFRELLPGNFSKLQPPEGQDLMDGLEIKVQLGPVWKQSLTELSGGQRSLIALSLIMALLQFKPAPMYILDEIDAALDLSHTQHIGQLFRTRFKGSQFIVVSLKEGLFTNANVLFRTRFRDGTSIVERTAQRSTSSLYAGDRGNQAEPSGAGRRGRR